MAYFAYKNPIPRFRLQKLVQNIACLNPVLIKVRKLFTPHFYPTQKQLETHNHQPSGQKYNYGAALMAITEYTTLSIGIALSQLGCGEKANLLGNYCKL